MTNSEKILAAMGDIPEQYIAEAMEEHLDGNLAREESGDSKTVMAADNIEETGSKVHRGNLRFVRWAAAIAACFCILIVGAGYGSSVYAKPVSYLSVDVNPSIELCLNRWHYVVQVTPMNEDGERICQDLHLDRKDYVKAFEQLLQDEKYAEYLSQNADLTVTIVSDQFDKLREGIQDCADRNQCTVNICNSDWESYTKAHEQDCSLGKYNCWQELCSYDDT